MLIIFAVLGDLFSETSRKVMTGGWGLGYYLIDFRWDDTIPFGHWVTCPGFSQSLLSNLRMYITQGPRVDRCVTYIQITMYIYMVGIYGLSTVVRSSLG